MTQHGIDYSNIASCGFLISRSTGFDDLKFEIIGKLNLDRNCLFTLQVRLNFGQPYAPFYNVITVQDQTAWDGILSNFVPSQGPTMVEIYVVEVLRKNEVTPRRVRSSSRPTSNIPSTSRNQTIEPNVAENTVLNNELAVIHECGGSSVNLGRDSDTFPAHASLGEELGCADIEYDDEGYETGDDEDLLEEEDGVCDVDPSTYCRPSAFNPYVGRGSTHPVAEFHNIGGFEEADVTFCGTQISGDREDFQVHATYSSKAELQRAVYEYHIKRNIEVEVVTSNKSKYSVRCKHKPLCKWRLYALQSGSGYWEIRSLVSEHSCFADMNRTDHQQLTARMVANCILPDLSANLGINISVIRGFVRNRYPHVQPTYNKLWRGREIAMADLFGSWEASYQHLTPLLNAIKRTNPGTKVIVQSAKIRDNNDWRLFLRAAWAFGPCIRSFEYMRPVISIDACFLSGRYKGQLIIACGYDAENQLVPLAFCIVESESNENWGWFMKWLKDNVIGTSRPVCVISDRAKSIRHVFTSDEYGWYEESGLCWHRYCLQHVSQNFGKNLRNDNREQWVKEFKVKSKKTKPRIFKDWMDRLEKWDENAFHYLLRVGKRNGYDMNERSPLYRWVHSLDTGVRWGIMTSNGSESLNNVFKVARQLPVSAIVEHTFYKCVEWYNDRYTKASELRAEGCLFSSRVHRLLHRRTSKGSRHSYKAMNVHERTYQVTHNNESTDANNFGEIFHYEVSYISGDIPQCTCQKPKLTGLPCQHVCRVVTAMNWSVLDVVNSYYSVDNLIATWSGGWHMFGNKCEWPEATSPLVAPDRNKITTGRRTHKRLPMAMDEIEGRIPSVEAARRRATKGSSARRKTNRPSSAS